MAFTRIATSDSEWRSFSYPAPTVSGARLCHWRAIVPHFVARGARSTSVHSSWEGESTGAQADTRADINSQSIPADGKQDTPMD